jgi:adenylate kinase
MKLMIFGPPGSGKGTYASRLAPKLGIIHISTGDIFREMAKEKSDFGKRIAGLLEKGEFVPDEIVNEILRKKISQKDAENGFILDGYPRTLNQAKALEKMAKIDAIVNIFVHEKILIERLSSRRICKKCGKIYNIADTRMTIDNIDYFFLPILPKRDGVCDGCEGKLYQREDDNPKVIKERLKICEKQSKPIIEFYKGKTKFANVISNRPLNVVVKKILAELKNLGICK